jgi:hypothetical protein
MLSSLCACAGKKQTVSFGTDAEPDSLTDEQKQYIIDCINKEHEKVHGDDYTPIKLEMFDNIYHHYGTYNGYVVLLSDGMLMATQSITFGSYVFRYHKNFGIAVFKDGVFTPFEEAIAGGMIKKDALDAIYAHHNDVVLPQFKTYDIDCPENAAPGELSEDVMSKFNEAFDQLGYNASLLHHYGTYNGVTLFYKDGEVKSDSRFYSLVVFDHNYETLYTDKEYSEMIVFKDGFFNDNVHYFTTDENNSYNLPVYDLYEENVNTIVQYHESMLADELKRVVIDYPENADPNTLPEDKLSALLASFKARHDAKADSILHYGTENGVILLLIHSSTDDIKNIDLDKELVLYKSGSFMPIQDYDMRNIFSLIGDAVNEAKEYHESITK